MYNFYLHNKQLFDQLDTFIDSLENKDSSLIQVLHHAQGIFGYLPKEVQLYISKRLNIASAKVYSVVNFYSYFTTEPKGKYKISVCLGAVCFAKGADKILYEFEKQLGIKAGQTSKDLLFSLDGLRCVGACGLAPVVVVNSKVYGQFKPEQVSDVLDYYKSLENTTI
ncbi:MULTISPECIES: complex I 24 kDa subunit family protein [Romboutsia]|uniref:NADH-quinone oxidoreductase subunit NuoE family protein n=1 Tax=Romboutsia TaxID=1501226 RepID=UPI00216D90C5|nr:MULTISPECIES: NAD(P)H-dependent oxidoreductase subunit E [Romboutsia]MCI9061853.1 NAD(P)H-dependent oxidoreductase subunit E [Romboutsia sp.]MCI9259617.1 NAD(P)H-dependent oxidoreductase subunit E [Romboutsia sp.]